MRHLRKKLGVKSVEYYVCRNVLRWLGHLARMKNDRMPKRLLYAWVPGESRKSGSPNTFGRYAYDILTSMPDCLKQDDKNNFARPPAKIVLDDGSTTSEPSPSTDQERIDLNTATQAELQTLPGIGSRIAGNIILARQQVGSFNFVQDLLHVSGISVTTFNKFRDKVCVEGDDGSTEEISPFKSGSTAETQWRKCQGWITMANSRTDWDRVCNAYLAQPKFN